MSKAADAAGAAIRVAENLGVHAAGLLAGLPIGALVAAAAAVALATIAVRVLVVRRALRRRVRWAVLPTDEFDPAPDSVWLFSRQLQRARRRRGDLLARPAAAVRIELRPIGTGGMLYGLAGPRRAQKLIRDSALPGTELHDPEALDLSGLDLGPMAQTEFVDQASDKHEHDDGLEVRA